MTVMSPTNQSAGRSSIDEYELIPLVHHKGVDVGVATEEMLFQ